MGNKYIQVQICDSIFDLGYPEIKLGLTLSLRRGVTGEKKIYKKEFAFMECLPFFSNNFFLFLCEF